MLRVCKKCYDNDQKANNEAEQEQKLADQSGFQFFLHNQQDKRG